MVPADIYAYQFCLIEFILKVLILRLQSIILF